MVDSVYTSFVDAVYSLSPLERSLRDR